MSYTVRNMYGSRYKDVSFEYGDTKIDVGLLCADERMVLSLELLGTVFNLVGRDFENHREFVEFVMDNVA